MKDDDGDWPVLRGERRVRFGCGVLAGLPIGIWLVTRISSVGFGAFVFVGGVAVAVGILAVLFGDRFWAVLVGWMPWLGD